MAKDGGKNGQLLAVLNRNDEIDAGQEQARVKGRLERDGPETEGQR